MRVVFWFGCLPATHGEVHVVVGHCTAGWVGDVGGMVIFRFCCLPSTHGDVHGVGGPGAGWVGDVGGRAIFCLGCLSATHGEIHGVDGPGAGGGWCVGGDVLGGRIVCGDVGDGEDLVTSAIISSISSFATIIVSSVGVLLYPVSPLCFSQNLLHLLHFQH